MSTRQLMDAGIIALRTNPHRIVVNIATYRHPTVPGLKVTLQPAPTVAGPSYWSDHWYDLHTKFDRVLVEDGMMPERKGTTAATWATVLRQVLPFTGHKMVVDSDINYGKYDQAQSVRDRIESGLAYNSVMTLMKPPVDPRARRAMEHLNSIASSMATSGDLATKTHNVAMPWGVFHSYYLRYRFEHDGWAVEKQEEVLMINQRQVAMIMFFMSFTFCFTLYTALKFMFYMIFGW
jgi:hypothetical protein